MKPVAIRGMVARTGKKNPTIGVETNNSMGTNKRKTTTWYRLTTLTFTHADGKLLAVMTEASMLVTVKPLSFSAEITPSPRWGDKSDGTKGSLVRSVKLVNGFGMKPASRSQGCITMSTT
mmetsp:Transcript_25332/g.57448  ORF Transcript_25332/g.57448 Transcript_25332/m.57448 type:complete len:120 (-) Transcript_25332:207-566(-)